MVLNECLMSEHCVSAGLESADGAGCLRRNICLLPSASLLDGKGWVPADVPFHLVAPGTAAPNPKQASLSALQRVPACSPYVPN